MFHIRSKTLLRRLLPFFTVIAIIAATIALRDTIDLDKAGYIGLGFTVLIATGGLILPVPSLAAACVVGSLLNPVYAAVIACSAGTIGESTGYFLGYSGRSILDGHKFYSKLEDWTRRRGWLVIFLVALIPNPIFDLVGIAAGTLRFPFWRFLLSVWIGKLLKFLTVTFGCAHSINWFSGLLGA